jgi:malate synthase
VVVVAQVAGADPPRLHGPYWQWTRKIAAKTACRWLSPAQREDYQAWIDNDRRLRDLLGQLEELGAAALDADPRWQRQPAPAGTSPRPNPADQLITLRTRPA